jgi:hypothetical protein
MDGMFKSLLISKANMLSLYSFISQIDPSCANYKCKRRLGLCSVLIIGSNNKQANSSFNSTNGLNLRMIVVLIA